MRSKAWLAAHAEVTKNVKYFLMGPKLRHTAVLGCRAENVHALEGLACRKRAAPASSMLAAAPGLLAHALVTKQ
jgi:hypothetical protein